jgi:hypothetical protein
MGLSIVYNKYNFIINLNEKNRDFLKKFNIRKLLCNTMEKVTFLWKYLYKSNLKKKLNILRNFLVFLLYYNFLTKNKKTEK